MLNVFLCEDNEGILKRYHQMLSDIAQHQDIPIHISCFTSSEALLFHMDQCVNRVDILYIDILMSGLNGIKTAKKLREMGCIAEIIYLTSSKEYVFDAFETTPMYYLIKRETTEEKFKEVFLKAISLALKKKQELFVCESGSVTQVIPLKDVSHFEIIKRIVTVYYNQETFDFYSKMEKLEAELLGKNFIRVHRSFLVNLKYICRFETEQLILTTGHQVPLGSSFVKSAKNAFYEYLSQYKMNH